MLGQLGEIPKASPVSVKPETQATPSTKNAEPTSAPTKKDLTTAVTKLQTQPAPITEVLKVQSPKTQKTELVKMETMATASSETILRPATADKQPLAVEPTMQPVTAVQQREVSPKDEVPKMEVENNKEPVKMELDSMTEVPKSEESKPAMSKPKVEVDVSAASSFPVTEAPVEPTLPVASEMIVANIYSGTEPKLEIKQLEPAESVQEPQSQFEPANEAGIRGVADKLPKNITDVQSSLETQPLSAKDVIISVSMGHFIS